MDGHYYKVNEHEKGKKMSTRMMIALFTIALAAALVLLAANSIRPSSTALTKAKTDVQDVQTQPSEVPTEVSSSNLPTQAPTPSPDTALQEAQSLLQTRCTQCHSVQKVLQAKKTRAEWEKTLSAMVSAGAKISDTEKRALLDYLTVVAKP